MYSCSMLIDPGGNCFTISVLLGFEFLQGFGESIHRDTHFRLERKIFNASIESILKYTSVNLRFHVRLMAFVRWDFNSPLIVQVLVGEPPGGTLSVISRYLSKKAPMRQG